MTATLAPHPAAAATTSVDPAPTPEDVLLLEAAGLFEFVDGQLVEKRIPAESNWIAGEVTFRLKLHTRQTGAGEVLPEQTFQCFPNDPDETRRPDVAFLLAAKVPVPWPPGHLRVVPDLAVEVVSPNDNLYAAEEKLADYRSAGVPVVWVFVPNVRLVRIHRLGGPVVELRDGDTLGGDPVLPGFAVAVTDLFPRRQPG